jgi:hypothetical protein
MKIHKFFIRAYSCSFVVQKVFGSSWISVTITQVRWFPSSSFVSFPMMIRMHENDMHLL